MPKFLLESTFTIDGVRGLVNDGGSKRAEVIREAVAAIGGRTESVHFSFGKYDTYVVCDLPDHKTAAALTIAIRAAGGVHTRITPVLTPEEVDEATRMKLTYQAPGK
ncbi:GYD domain-containing protein [Micromonospora eburnea]|uniref:Uncharacterized protein, contains GYD domain n=1 Tax=Micromonospora eburnea TaxID=227316 RepID=A0A1C6TV40_9ACTN|nr:GYD domain-containing protein [Micromonospora eburnea]SCL45654.1 Uncharacterized protein, contains GYD domain [Micromonospora eburnea]